MSFRAIWPPNADHRVTVRATEEQLVSWGVTARHLSNRPLPVFLAFAADFVVKYYDEIMKKAEAAERRREKARQKKREQP
jgi:hypothetical protein